MAKANLRIQQGSYSPTLGLSAGWNRQQSSGNTSSLPQTITQYADASLSMSWEVDVFGSIRNRVKAQKENFAASKEEYNAVMVSLCAQVASAYINLRELQQEVDVVTQNCLSQQAVVEITRKRYETGLVSKLDVAQAQSVYYSTKASLPMLEAGIIQYTNALAVLMGLYPQDVKGLIDHPRPPARLHRKPSELDFLPTCYCVVRISVLPNARSTPRPRHWVHPNPTGGRRFSSKVPSDSLLTISIR